MASRNREASTPEPELTDRQKQMGYAYALFMVFLAVAANVIFIFLSRDMAPHRRIGRVSPLTLQAGDVALAILCIVLPIAWARLRSPIYSQSLLLFMREIGTSLQLVSVCVVVGMCLFFLGGSLRGFIGLALIATAMDLFFVLPRVLAYRTKMPG